MHIEYLPDREMLGYMTSLNKLKRREIIQNMFSNHNTMKLEISNNKIWDTQNVKLDKTFLNNLRVKEEIKKERPEKIICNE